jgi:hypothetical protein
LTTYHITHSHTYENCYGPPQQDEETMSLWQQIGKKAKENNVDIKFFKMNPSEHVSFILLEATDYADVEKTIGQCKKTGEFTITPVIDQIFF